MATALTQADVDRLERAIAQGVQTVEYAAGRVVYQSTSDMLKALAYAKQQLAAASDRSTASTLAVYSRD